MTYLHGQALIDAAMKHVGRHEYSSMCAAFCVLTAGTGGVGDFDGDRAADAQDGWKKAKAKGQVVLAKDIGSLKEIPGGTFGYWEGGSRGFGHQTITLGDGECISTDAPTWGRIGTVPIDWISRTWRNGLVFRGYAVIEGNGHRMVDKIPTPKPIDRMNPAAYFIGAHGDHVTWLGQRLVAHGFGRFYKVGPGPAFTMTDREAVSAFQQKQGWRGAAADGFPGPETLRRLAA